MAQDRGSFHLDDSQDSPPIVAYAISIMSAEATMDDIEADTLPDVDGDTGTDDVVSNGDLANRRRRQQVRQACQQCRRRKIKVCTPFRVAL